MNFRHDHSCRGFSLIECMVALVVLSIGLGGVALLMYESVGGLGDARSHQLAAVHAASLSDLLRSGANDADLDWWRLQWARDVPGASASICQDSTPYDGDASDPACNSPGPLTIKLFWDEGRLAVPAW
jgi:prepilin-type N-terminal cleavage/methylation domain-containing protein